MTPAEKIKAALLAQKERANGGNSGARRSRSTGDKALYPFWDAPLGGEPVVLRFLPDADQDNTFFWRNREIIRLPFNGISGGDYPTTKPVEVTVPCMNMFGKKDFIIDYCKPWWKDEASAQEKLLAKTYWKKKSFIFQGFVVKSPIQEEDAPENPIRRLTINPQLFKIIENALLDGDMEELPTHYEAGCDFTVKKTKQGDFNSYNTSGYNRRSRSLSEEERSAIDTFGLFDLKASLGEEPDADRVALIEALFKSSLAGDAFDTAAFGDHFRAYGNSRDADTAAVVEAAVAARPIVHAVQTPIVETAYVAPIVSAPVAPVTPEAPRKKTPQEILAEIHAKMPS